MNNVALLLCVMVALAVAAPMNLVKKNKRDDGDCPSITCAELGAPCGETDVGSEEKFTNCIAPYLCLLDGVAGKCRAHLASGEKCLDSFQCNDQSYHPVQNYCNSKGVCAPTLEAGETCDTEDSCLPPSFCNDDGLCVNPFTRKLNESCTEDLGCIETLQCVAGSCQAFAMLDEPCGDPEDGLSECSWDFTCLSGKCVELGTVAESQECGMTLACEKGLVCNNDGVCAKPSLNTTETPCESTDDCDSASICACDFEEGFQGCFPLAPWTDDIRANYDKYTNCMDTHNNNVYKCTAELQAWTVSDPDEVISDVDLWCMV